MPKSGNYSKKHNITAKVASVPRVIFRAHIKNKFFRSLVKIQTNETINQGFDIAIFTIAILLKNFLKLLNV